MALTIVALGLAPGTDGIIEGSEQTTFGLSDDHVELVDGICEPIVASALMTHSAGYSCDQFPSTDRALCCDVRPDGGCGDGYAWTCQDSNGDSVTVQNKCGNGAQLGPFVDASGAQRYVLKDITNATAPRILAADVASAGLDTIWTASHTAIFVGTQTTNTSSTPRPLEAGDYTISGLMMDDDPTGKHYCYWSDEDEADTNDNANVSGLSESAYAIVSCRWDGSGDFTARVNGNSSTTSDDITPKASSEDIAFGEPTTGGAQAIRGSMLAVAVYSTDLTDAQLSEIEADVMGLTARPSNVSIDRDSMAFIEGENGQHYAVCQDMTIVQPDGLEVRGSVTNYATDSLDLTAWVEIGSPTVTADQSAGPFAPYNGGDEADLLSGASGEGVESGSAGTASGDYTCSVFAQDADGADLKLDIFKDGSSAGLCTETLTGSFERYECTQNVATSASTDITCRLLLTGNDDVHLSGAQFEQSSFAGRPCPAEGSARTCLGDDPSQANDGNVPFARGRAVFNAVRFVDTGTRVALLTAAAGTTNGWYIYLNSSDDLVFRPYNASSTDACVSSPITWPVDTEALFDVRWAGTEVQMFMDGTLLQSCSLSLAPGSNTDPLLLGTDPSANEPDGGVYAVRVYR